MARPKPQIEISEYERKRAENIAKTQALLRQLESEAVSAGLAPTAKNKPAAAKAKAKAKAKSNAPKKVKEEVVPTRTSSRLRGIVADSEVAKRKADEEEDRVREAERAKRRRVVGDLALGDILVGGKEGGWKDLLGPEDGWKGLLGPARPGERALKREDVEETKDEGLKGLRERMGGLRLWGEWEPGEIKITPEKIYSIGFHPSADKPLVFAGDKMGNLGICDCSQSSSSGVKNEDEDEENDVREGPAITTFKLHSRTIHTFQFSPVDYNALYSASYDSSIRKLDLAKGVAVEVYAPPESSEAPLSGVEVTSHNPHMLYFSTLEGQFGIYDMRTPAQKAAGLEIFQLSEKKIGGFTLHPEKPHFLATASLDRTLKIWDLRKISGKGEDRLPTLVGEHESKLSVSHAAWNGEGMVATASYDDTIKIHDFSACGKWKAGTTLSSEEMDPVRVIPHNNQTGRWVTILRPQWQQRPQDGVQRFCIGNMNRFVDVYTGKGELLAQLGGDGISAVPAVARFHPERDWVAAGTASGKLCLWM